MIFSAEVSAVLLLFVVIIYPNDGVNGYKGEPCNYKVERVLSNFCVSNGRGTRDVSQLQDPKSEVNRDSGRPLRALHKRGIYVSPDPNGPSGTPPPISDHDLSMRMDSTNSDEIIGHPSRAARDLFPPMTPDLEAYSARCCGETDDCDHPPPSIIPCPGVKDRTK